MSYPLNKSERKIANLKERISTGRTKEILLLNDVIELKDSNKKLAESLSEAVEQHHTRVQELVQHINQLRAMLIKHNIPLPPQK